ncbi:MAG: hypothetical protein ABF297_00335 [Thiogranum sp.]
MLRAQKVLPAILFATLVLFIVSENQSAPPVRDKVLEEVEVLKNDGQSVIEVQFSFPLRYRSHFPQQSGEELRIRLLPVRIPSSDLNAAFKREGVVPRHAEDLALDEVIYEGDSEGGPYLILNFSRPVSYEVIPGSDYRSMSVVVRSLD